MDERSLAEVAAAAMSDRGRIERFRRAYRGPGDSVKALRSVLASSPDALALARLRAAVYRPGADGAAVAAYLVARDRTDRIEAAVRAALVAASGPGEDGVIAPAPLPERHRRPGRRAVLAAAVVALAAGTAVALALSGGVGVERDPHVAVEGLRPGRLSDPVLLAWDSEADRGSAQRAAVAAAFDGTGDLRRAAATLTGFTSPTERPAAAAGGRGVTRATVSLDRFGEVVTPMSRIDVLVACERGRFRMTLGTVTQGRSQIIVAPLAVASGPCGRGVEQIRYRPIRGLLPTTATLQVPAGSEGVLDVSITG